VNFGIAVDFAAIAEIVEMILFAAVVLAAFCAGWCCRG
jgi:hypothetical protein